MKRLSSDQSGYILVLSIFTIIALLFLGALAIETGNLYIWKLRLDRAAKASVLAGLGYRANQGWNALYKGGLPPYSGGETVLDFTSNADAQTLPVRTEMQAVFENTLRAGKLPASASWYFFGNPSITRLQDSRGAGFDLQRDTATMDVTLEIPTLFAGALDFFGIRLLCNAGTAGQSCRVNSVQSASLNPAHVVLILDTSGSMECDSAEPSSANCACRKSTTNPCPSRPTQAIKQLKAAVHEFHGFFNPTRDRIAIIPFNLGAQVVADFSLWGGFGANITTYQNFRAAIDSLTPNGNTNPCDAFVRANDLIDAFKSELDTFFISSNVRPFFVFFTDGAPNAMRTVFTQPVPGSTLDAPSPILLPTVFQYSIDWQDSLGNYRTPSPPFLDNTDTVFFDPALKPFPMFNRAIGLDGLPKFNSDIGEVAPTKCGEPWFERTQLRYLGSLDWSRRGETSKADGCLLGTNFQLPFSSWGTWGLRYLYGVAGVPFSDTGKTVPYTDQLAYYCTIEAADFARQQLGATIFAVGLGAKGPSCLTSDPLQDSDNPFIRKDNFLARTAFDLSLTRNGNTCDFADSFKFSEGRRPVTIPLGCSHSNAGKTIHVGYTPYPDKDLPATTTPTSRKLSTFPSGTEGDYIPIETAKRLRFTFSRIAKQILMRLTG